MSWELNGNPGTTAANYVGTSDQMPLVLKTNGQERLRIDAAGNIGMGTANINDGLTLFTRGGGNPVSAMSVNVGTFGTADNLNNSYFFCARDMGVNPPQGKKVFFIRGDGSVFWGNSALVNDQGGSIELGGIDGSPGSGTPYIDFHFNGLQEAYNTRIINDNNKQLSILADSLNVSGNIGIGGNVTVGGDVFLPGADCAEQFEIRGTEVPEPGTVVVIDEEGGLRESHDPYDKKVAGVVSGGGDYRPAILLDKRSRSEGRVAIALVGKVYCKVDANCSSIEIGDLLTTSSTPGHAMKVVEPMKCIGAVIGKALRPLANGRGLIPILVALQ